MRLSLSESELEAGYDQAICGTCGIVRGQHDTDHTFIPRKGDEWCESCDDWLVNCDHDPDEPDYDQEDDVYHYDDCSDYG